VLSKAVQTSWDVERPTALAIASSVREERRRLRRLWSVAFHAM